MLTDKCQAELTAISQVSPGTSNDNGVHTEKPNFILQILCY